MSFGSSEFTSEQFFDSAFTTPSGHQGVTFVASTGDCGSSGDYPACSPNVLAVGGTSLHLNGDNTYQSELPGPALDLARARMSQSRIISKVSRVPVSGPFPTLSSMPTRTPACRFMIRTTRPIPGFRRVAQAWQRPAGRA